MVITMDAHERAARIQELRESNDQLRAEREERERARESDCFAMDDHLRAERSAEPERDAYVQRNDAAAGLVYKRMDDALQRASEPDWSAWEAWMKGHLDNLREEMIDAVAEAVMTLIHRERDAFDRELAVLKAENREVKAMLGEAVARLGQTDEKLKALVNDLNSEHKDHAAQISGFETALAELRGRVSAILRDWTT